jgi:hypothetical protein
MAFKLSGKLTEVFDIQKISESFKKREFVIDSPDEYNGKTYPNMIKFQLNQDKCDIIDEIGVGEDITVNFNIKGNKWEKNGNVSYFTNLVAFKIERESLTASQENIQSAPPDFPMTEDDNELPF